MPADTEDDDPRAYARRVAAKAPPFTQRQLDSIAAALYRDRLMQRHTKMPAEPNDDDR